MYLFSFCCDIGAFVTCIIKRYLLTYWTFILMTDGQLYFYVEPYLVASLVDAVSCCIGEINKWMSSNRLELNADKTLESSFNLEKVDIQSVNLGAGTVLFQSSVNDLGVLIDSTLTMRDHVHRVCRTLFYQLRQICVIRKSLTRAVSEALLHAFISSRL